MGNARYSGDRRVSGVFSDHYGIWKVFGTIAIVVPGFPQLKEWAMQASSLECQARLHRMHSWGTTELMRTIFGARRSCVPGSRLVGAASEEPQILRRR